MKPIKILILTLLFTAGQAHAQEGCCQVSADSCASPVSETQCEELNGTFHEGGTCRTDSGKCGVLQDNAAVNPALIVIIVLVVVIAVVFLAKQMRKSPPSE
jgi:hypothetical protein